MSKGIRAAPASQYFLLLRLRFNFNFNITGRVLVICTLDWVCVERVRNILDEKFMLGTQRLRTWQLLYLLLRLFNKFSYFAHSSLSGVLAFFQGWQRYSRFLSCVFRFAVVVRFVWELLNRGSFNLRYCLDLDSSIWPDYSTSFSDCFFHFVIRFHVWGHELLETAIHNCKYIVDIDCFVFDLLSNWSGSFLSN